jgi:enamine deaminase RidA (YjgF/YER057c/UK114 family)
MASLNNPPELHATPGYHHVTIARTARTIHLAGQCPVTPDGKVVDGDICHGGGAGY